MNDPIVTIVMPVFNHWDLTRNALTYVMEQTKGVPYRVIVVDDGSSDGTSFLLHEFAQDHPNLPLAILHNESNRGFAHSCNRGIVKALSEGADYVLLLNNDIEIWQDTWLADLLAPFQHEKRLLVGCDYVDYNSAALVDGVMEPYISGWCMLIPKQLFAEVGLLDERLDPAYYEDVLFSAQARRAGWRLFEVKTGIFHISGRTATDGHHDLSAIHAKNRPIFQNAIRELRGEAAKGRAIAFYFPASNIIFDDSYLEGQGLGGAESSLVELTRELARQGADVHVFCRCPAPGVYSGVHYHDYLDSAYYTRRWGLFTLFRVSPPGGRGFWDNITAGVRAFWSCDQYTTMDWPQTVFPYVDKIVGISPYHRDFLLSWWKAPPHKTTYFNLGVHWPDYAEEEPKQPNLLIYCSVPTRGLIHLARILPMVQAEVPDATLAVTADFRLWGVSDPGDREFRAKFAGLRGVTYLGRIGKRALISWQKQAVLHVFPCDYMVAMPPNYVEEYPGECFCRASIECQAAGTPTIATAAGALSTTVDNGNSGYLLNVMPDQEEFDERFTGVVLDLLEDEATRRAMALYARERVRREFTWEVIARQWLNMAA